MSATDWLTLALVIITAVYAAATFRILKANQAAVQVVQEQTTALMRPYISVEVTARTGTTLLVLSVKNTGKSAAENLSMSLDKPLVQRLDSYSRDLRTLPLFSGVPTALAAGAEIQHILGVGHRLMNETSVHGMPETFNIEASYKFGPRAFRETHTVDVRALIHAAVIHDPIATALEKLGEKLEKAIAEASLQSNS